MGMSPRDWDGIRLRYWTENGNESTGLGRNGIEVLAENGNDSTGLGRNGIEVLAENGNDSTGLGANGNNNSHSGTSSQEL